VPIKENNVHVQIGGMLRTNLVWCTLWRIFNCALLFLYIL